jgi:SAM-dependent methyltransferase
VATTSSGERSGADLEVLLPDQRGATPLDQDEEWCEALVDGHRLRIRFHDYDVIFGIPGLYEHLFYDLLECRSPRVVARLLGRVLAEQGVAPHELRVLDVGAGNGMVGEEIRALGAGAVIGVDILPEAAAATRRDRPGVYDDYLVADLTDLRPAQRESLVAAQFTAMTTVAALGFGDIPPAAFATAFNLVAVPGLLAFNIKEDFLSGDDPSGFQRLIRRMLDEQVIVPLAEEHHRHRLSVHGEPLYYVAYVARKQRDVPATWLE